MDFYELVKFLHILAAIIWIGGAFLLILLGERAFRAEDRDEVGRIMVQAGFLAKIVFIPASLIVVVLGVVMVTDAWAFDQLWIILALVGFAASFVLGAGVLGPRSERVGAALATEGMTDANYADSKRVLTLARFDYVLLLLIVFDMVVKPTSDDAGALAVMALALVGGAALVWQQYKAITETPGAPTTAAAA